jgi:homoserine O-acetyltransferase
MDWFDLAEAGGGDVLDGLARIRIERALAIGANTDILFPVQQQQEVAEGLARGGAQAGFIGMDSPQGHDAFLVDLEHFGPAVRDFLDGL